MGTKPKLIKYTVYLNDTYAHNALVHIEAHNPKDAARVAIDKIYNEKNLYMRPQLVLSGWQFNRLSTEDFNSMELSALPPSQQNDNVRIPF